jgi:hypothetical protein
MEKHEKTMGFWRFSQETNPMTVDLPRKSHGLYGLFQG